MIKNITTICSYLTLSFALAACGGGGSGSSDSDDNVTDSPVENVKPPVEENESFDPSTNDQDSDGILDDVDNCPFDVNIDQANYDRDGQGDVCDPDDDNDGVDDITDAFPQHQTAWLDSDNDGIRDEDDIFPTDASNWDNFEFQHPGVFISQEQLNAMITSFNAGERDEYYDDLLTGNNSERIEDLVIPSSTPTFAEMQTFLKVAAIAANRYVNEFVLSGNLGAEANAIEVFNRLSVLETLPLEEDEHTKLEMGIKISAIYHAAELLRTRGTSWSQADQDEFSAMTRRAVIPVLNLYRDTRSRGNWQLAMGHSMLALTVWLEDKQLFREAIERFHQNSTVGFTSSDITHDNARMNLYFLPNGQNGETTRDQVHSKMGLVGAVQIAQIAWNQGIDLWESEHHSLGRAAEHFALYNYELVDDVPVQVFPKPYLPNSTTSTGLSPVIEPLGRGHYRPVYEMIHSHYRDYRNTIFPAVQAKADEKLDEPGNGAFIYGDLYYRDLPGIVQTHDPVDTSVEVLSEQSTRLPLVALNFGGYVVHDRDRRVVFGSAPNSDLLYEKPIEIGEGYETTYIKGTNNPDLYRMFIKNNPTKDQLGFFIDIPNGNYEYRFHFAELEYSEVGDRVFDVLLEGEVVKDNLDIVDEVGAETALIISGQINISDGTLNAEFKNYDWDSTNVGAMDPVVSGFELIPLD